MSEEEEKKELRDMVAVGVLIGLVAAGGTFEESNTQLAKSSFELANEWMKERELHHAR